MHLNLGSTDRGHHLLAPRRGFPETQSRARDRLDEAGTAAARLEHREASVHEHHQGAAEDEPHVRHASIPAAGQTSAQDGSFLNPTCTSKTGNLAA